MNVDSELRDVNYALLGLPFDTTRISIRLLGTLCSAHPGNTVFYPLCPWCRSEAYGFPLGRY